GAFEIWIDGKTDPRFMKTVPSFEKWAIDGADGWRVSDALDEFAFYNKALSPQMIRLHWTELQRQEHYSFKLMAVESTKVAKEDYFETYQVDDKEFAPGYPNYTIQATDQLKSFPLPRYAAGIDIPRNIPWMDITYLHRELTSPGAKGFGKVNPLKAIELTDELAKNWNYYIELPTLRVDSETARKRYTDSVQIFSSLIKYANQNPQLPAVTILMQMQNKPSDAGLGSKSAYVRRQDLPNKYYMEDKKGVPIINSNKKWLSPFTGTELIEKDALTSVFYINQLAGYLTRPLNTINENGEWFGHQWKTELLEKSPEIISFLKDTGMDYYRFNGWMQNRFDSVYKTTILHNIPWKDVKFTFYNVSAYNSSYWPDYRERINTNSYFNGTPRSTPSFYPSKPQNWRTGAGPLNGYGKIAEGRKKEFELGVKYFAPFVNAGWGLEENNIRPAQWLGLLKSMVMLGADFFHVGYFNVTGNTGWPNGKGPNDPRGYIYQAAMPAYAQAMASHVMDFLENGELLEDPNTNEQRMPYAFAASAPNHLVMVRKLGNRYLIFGTIQPNSNYKGNSDIEIKTQIEINKKKISFNIRRQGSMYILDLSKAQPLFWQLDGWHQYEHPYYWIKDVEIEAENADKIPEKSLITEAPNLQGFDFNNFTTYVRLSQNSKIQCRVPANRSKTHSLAIIAKVVDDNATLVVKTAFNSVAKKISNKMPKEILISVEEMKTLGLKVGDNLTISVNAGIVLLDKIKF
ncbi:MAG: hypothetical protein J0I84_00440, partial [Terrimonas sp.]|nr:hypothetical protein [Terrimonas sp.]